MSNSFFSVPLIDPNTSRHEDCSFDNWPEEGRPLLFALSKLFVFNPLLRGKFSNDEMVQILHDFCHDFEDVRDCTEHEPAFLQKMDNANYCLSVIESLQDPSLARTNLMKRFLALQQIKRETEEREKELTSNE